MKLFIRYVILAILLSFLGQLRAQLVSDTAINIPMISFHYSFHLPQGDMARRFGPSSSVGGDFTYKTTAGWLLGLDYSFIFGEKILNKEGYFKDIQTENGFVIDGNGMLAEVYLYERGFNLAVIVGRQFHYAAPNPNSGPFVQLHFGYMQSYVRIENPYLTAPQVTGEYAKLYDRLAGGFSMSEFIGYRYMSNNRLWNFYAGIELIQGYTTDKRSYNADEHSAVRNKHHDNLWGLRIGWAIPLYGTTKQEFYYY